MAPTILQAIRLAVAAAFGLAVAIAATHWAVRRGHLQAFGPWPRLVRRLSDPLLDPIERRLLRSGGNPQDAPLWLVGLVVVGGLILVTAAEWVGPAVGRMRLAASSGPRGLAALAVGVVFTVLSVALIVRVVGSWFGLTRYRAGMGIVYRLTDWMVEPIRRVLPPAGIFDFSPMVAWLLLIVVRAIVMSLLR